MPGHGQSLTRRALALGLPLLAAGCAGPARPPAEPLIVPVPAWGGSPTPEPAQAQAIRQLTLHHQGEIWQPGTDLPAYLRRLQRWSREARGWADIPYHYVVGPDGQAYAARPWQMPGDTNTEYDPRGHLLVMLVGNFEVQHLAPAQWEGCVALLAHLLARHGLGIAQLSTHRDHSTQTLCPGAHLLQRFGELKAAVAARLARPSAASNLQGAFAWPV